SRRAGTGQPSPPPIRVGVLGDGRKVTIDCSTETRGHGPLPIHGEDPVRRAFRVVAEAALRLDEPITGTGQVACPALEAQPFGVSGEKRCRLSTK
ncbi:MAG: hypothetical protein LC647_18075, partial [Beggiatoa sp.]|nr:hypothetical protein [Beggiatoa sp.]